jgi:hypothetical protein
MSGREAGREVQEMVKVSVEVQSGAAHFRVAVQAQSIRRAVSLVGARYSDAEVRVKFPIEPEGFFVEGAGARAEMVEQPKKLAAWEASRQRISHEEGRLREEGKHRKYEEQAGTETNKRQSKERTHRR